jgi:hypothetical protein
VHLRGSWIERQASNRILDFSRAVSCGPALPLVVSPTTIHNRMNIAVSYRTTGFSQGKIEGIMDSFVGQLESLPSDIEHGTRAGRATREVCAA